MLPCGARGHSCLRCLWVNGRVAISMQNNYIRMENEAIHNNMYNLRKHFCIKGVANTLTLLSSRCAK